LLLLDFSLYPVSKTTDWMSVTTDLFTSVPYILGTSGGKKLRLQIAANLISNGCSMWPNNYSFVVCSSHFPWLLFIPSPYIYIGMYTMAILGFDSTGVWAQSFALIRQVIWADLPLEPHGQLHLHHCLRLPSYHLLFHPILFLRKNDDLPQTLPLKSFKNKKWLKN
jgi:hypothetical protein